MLHSDITLQVLAPKIGLLLQRNQKLKLKKIQLDSCYIMADKLPTFS